MANCPDYETNQPKPQAKADGTCKRTACDCEASRCAAEQDVLSKRTVNRNVKSRRYVCLVLGTHATNSAPLISAPPPNEKKDRKNELVAVMMITEMTLATGPWIDSTIDCSGPSHGIDDPAA
jgi:hypothetical protein